MSLRENRSESIENITPESLNLLVNTVQELSLARDLETVMKIVRTAARKLTGADGATFVLREDDLCHYADEDAISPLWKGSRFPITACISGWAMLNAKAAVIDDIYMDYRVPADAYRPTFVKSLVMVPIRTKDPIGAIGNYWAEHHHATKEQVWLLQSLADATAVSMENVKIYGELERRVKERTQQLETINKELEAFSYTVSHDLKAPIRIINGYIDMMVEDHAQELSEKARKRLDTIQERASGLNEMIDRMLVFYKTTAREPQKSMASMNRLVAEIVEDMKKQERTRDIEFIVHDLPEACVDLSLIRHAWYNLISNAVKYTSTRSKAIIEIAAEEKEGINYLVKDNGVGFDMRYAHKLFGVFQRLHGPEEFEGSGIGLASVQRIIHRHGGKVWAYAKPGEGATFYFSLPR